MFKKVRRTNLQFFNDNCSDSFENDLQLLIEKVQQGKISIKHALEMFEKATADVHLIFWHMTHAIGDARVVIRNMGNDAPILDTHYRLDVPDDLPPDAGDIADSLDRPCRP